MARVNVPVQNITNSGLNPSSVAANALGHDVVNNNGRTIIVITNGNGASTVTLSITPSDVREGLNRETRDIAIPNGEKRVISDLSPDLFEQPSGTDKGKAYLDFAGGDLLTSVTVEAYVAA